MKRLIAIRKPHPQTQASLQDLSPMEKRTRQAERAEQADESDQMTALKSLGFQEILDSQDTTVDVWDDLPRRERVVDHLGYLDAFVLTAPDRQAEDSISEVLGEEYLILPNVTLSAPEPVDLGIRGRRRRTEFGWTEASGVALAHQDGITGQGVQVGVLDTGCDADHVQLRDRSIRFCYVNPVFPDRIRQVRGFDVDGHGTHVCGIIAGQDIGVAPGVDLLVASVIESESLTTSLHRISTALNWMLARFVEVEDRAAPALINLSLGFHPADVRRADRAAILAGIQIMLGTMLNEFAVLPVVAIGNDGPGRVCAPGYFSEVLSVGAVDDSHHPWGRSGSGQGPDGGLPKPDVVGYGVDIFSSLERDDENRSLYGELSGTSMAAPYVTGIAALYAARDPSLQGHDLWRKIIETALPLTAPADRVGAGLARYVR